MAAYGIAAQLFGAFSLQDLLPMLRRRRATRDSA
jgi:hypothetical protein